MLPHATDTLFPKHRTLAPAILVGTVQLVWPSVSSDDYKCTCTPGFKGKNCRKAVGI